ncbi:hypothetical protein UFOVP1492_122 [uncultured Caudovirales phage]|uniref:Uncharacterized protein n=1 Tax=uncultured Caudovirales phage TaxID=2100421 RepID=A0A6J5SRQ0_9CAUD|nr:hypothetical protein UFOVP1127_12 [uncultured Caudovirales phage]CAB4193338.1 hypothetical protein UFOVP1242_62 [uncultured Caudovirales phage]CAB4217900.1 hypothetical protein UFOVP1492_122 [uncultured Caudovirales phage]CAB5231055.1 hypothetical protein UFOVP1580_15 [uncultured Caudovirales phage]
MPGLLSNQNILDIRGALRLATDTFFNSPVTVRHYGENADPWQEDSRTVQSFDDYVVSGLIEWPKTNPLESAMGTMSTADMKVTFSMDVLGEMSLLTAAFEVKFNEAVDTMFYGADEYHKLKIYYDGPLEQKNVLCIIEGTRKERVS